MTPEDEEKTSQDPGVLFLCGTVGNGKKGGGGGGRNKMLNSEG